MYAVTWTSGLRLRMSELHPAQRIAVVVWTVLIVAVSARVAISKNDSGSVFPVYRTAATAWVEGVDLYTLDFSKPCFRYHPLIAAAFVPLNSLPEKVAAIFWRLLGTVLMLAGLLLWRRQFLNQLSPAEIGWLFLLAAPLALQSLNNGQVNLHLIGLLMLALVAADRRNWTIAALLLALGTVFKIYPIAVGLLMMLALPRAFALRYLSLLAIASCLPFALQSPRYVAGQYQLWLEYLLVDARHSAAIEQAPRDLFLLIRYWVESPPDWLYQLVQLGSAALIAIAVLRRRRVDSAVLPVILYLGCLWMTLLGPSTESCTYTLLAPVAAAMLVSDGRQRRLPFKLALIGYAFFLLPVVAAAFPGGTRIQHFGPQPAGAIFLVLSVLFWLKDPESPISCRETRNSKLNFTLSPCCQAAHFP